MTNKQMQLYILPYAGGSIENFNKLSRLIDNRIEVITIEYSGRGTRAKEPLAVSFDELLKDAFNYAVTRRNENLPFSVLGYSMGGIFAYEFLARDVLKGKLVHTFICAETSPKERLKEFSKVSHPTDALVLNRARQLGGVDERIVDNKRFFDIYMKPMISDYKLLYDYRFEFRKTINSNITFFYCEADTPRASLEGWSELIIGHYDYYEFGENHFFINHHFSEMAAIINEHLKQYLI